jgi:hypothetical protein
MVTSVHQVSVQREFNAPLMTVVAKRYIPGSDFNGVANDMAEYNAMVNANSLFERRKKKVKRLIRKE